MDCHGLGLGQWRFVPRLDALKTNRIGRRFACPEVKLPPVPSLPLLLYLTLYIKVLCAPETAPPGIHASAELLHHRSRPDKLLIHCLACLPGHAALSSIRPMRLFWIIAGAGLLLQGQP